MKLKMALTTPWLSSFFSYKTLVPKSLCISIALLVFLVGILNTNSYLYLRRDSWFVDFHNPVSQCTNSTRHLIDRNPSDTRFFSGSGRNGSQNVYEVCVVIVIGDDSGKPTKTALPFSVLRRLFEAVLQVKGLQGVGEVGLLEPDLQGVLVRVDYTSVVCKMVRDALGQSVTCESFLNLPELKQQASCETLIVGETKKYVEQACAIWTDKLQYKNLKIVNLDEMDPASQPPTLMTWRPTIVTGFSRNHLRVGLLLLRSVGRAAANPIVSKHYNVSLVVWVMEEFTSSETEHLNCTIKELKDVYHINVELRKADFAKYPTWMRINPSLFNIQEGGRGEYAWKAVFIHTILVERGFVLWLDAGGRIVKPSALLNTLNWIKRYGFACRNSEGKVRHWTHLAQLKYFRADFDYLRQQRNCDGSRLGFTLETYKDLIRPWYECSITRQCIAPDGSNRSNHRQDQAALTVLSVLSHHSCTGVDAGISRQNDVLENEKYKGVDKTRCYEDPLML
ncbi:hypothetical protein CY35_16G087200 [Sphagnum magellanicum]|nr:hypothetical protein CY35_16G087200 [Sphagnum magellanicum]